MKYQVKYKIWFEKDGKFLLGEGSADLLSKIDELGSISHASKAVNISYKKAWKIIREIEDLTGETLIISKRGGAKGGGTTLTKMGKKILYKYRELDEKIKKCLKEE